jgi:hypothetical protein
LIKQRAREAKNRRASRDKTVTKERDMCVTAEYQPELERLPDQVMHPEAGGTMTWQQCTLLISTMLLPMGADARDFTWGDIAGAYCRALRSAGYDEQIIAANLSNMLARVAESVRAMELSGGAIGTA